MYELFTKEIIPHLQNIFSYLCDSRWDQAWRYQSNIQAKTSTSKLKYQTRVQAKIWKKIHISYQFKKIPYLMQLLITLQNLHVMPMILYSYFIKLYLKFGIC